MTGPKRLEAVMYCVIASLAMLGCQIDHLPAGALVFGVIAALSARRVGSD